MPKITQSEVTGRVPLFPNAHSLSPSGKRKRMCFRGPWRTTYPQQTFWMSPQLWSFSTRRHDRPQDRGVGRTERGQGRRSRQPGPVPIGALIGSKPAGSACARSWPVSPSAMTGLLRQPVSAARPAPRPWLSASRPHGPGQVNARCWIAALGRGSSARCGRVRCCRRGLTRVGPSSVRTNDGDEATLQPT